MVRRNCNTDLLIAAPLNSIHTYVYTYIQVHIQTLLQIQLCLPMYMYNVLTGLQPSEQTPSLWKYSHCLYAQHACYWWLGHKTGESHGQSQEICPSFHQRDVPSLWTSAKYHVRMYSVHIHATHIRTYVHITMVQSNLQSWTRSNHIHVFCSEATSHWLTLQAPQYFYMYVRM